MKLSIAMATMNEEEAVAKVIRDAQKYGAPWNPEIVVVDSSKDKTPEIASGLGAKVIQQEPQGHGIALRTAMFAATGDVIITADCDDTYPMEYIPEFMKLVEQSGYDIVSGNRMKSGKHSIPFLNIVTIRLLALFVRLLYGIRTHDVTTGMHAVRREVVHSIDWKTNYSFPVELIIKSNQNGYNWRELIIPYRPRIGQIKLNRWRSGKAYLRFIVGNRFHLNLENKII